MIRLVGDPGRLGARWPPGGEHYNALDNVESCSQIVPLFGGQENMIAAGMSCPPPVV
jgi:hypothetical protein